MIRGEGRLLTAEQSRRLGLAQPPERDQLIAAYVYQIRRLARAKSAGGASRLGYRAKHEKV